jgi:hypothetical protein
MGKKALKKAASQVQSTKVGKKKSRLHKIEEPA